LVVWIRELSKLAQILYQELDVDKVGVFYCHRDHKLVQIVVEFNDLSSGSVGAVDILVSLNTFEQVNHGLFLNLIKAFTYFLCKL